jgi:hypothetical protein
MSQMNQDSMSSNNGSSVAGVPVKKLKMQMQQENSNFENENNSSSIGGVGVPPDDAKLEQLYSSFEKNVTLKLRSTEEQLRDAGNRLQTRLQELELIICLAENKFALALDPRHLEKMQKINSKIQEFEELFGQIGIPFSSGNAYLRSGAIVVVSDVVASSPNKDHIDVTEETSQMNKIAH